MNLRNLLLIAIIFSTIAPLCSAEAPSDEIRMIASQQVKDLDEKLILVDPNTALSETQKELITDLFIEKIKETRKIKQSNSEHKQEQIDELMTKIMRRLHYEILSKSQREAKFEYQKNYESK